MEIVGYGDRLSVARGERIGFMVSTPHAEYEAALVRPSHSSDLRRDLDAPLNGSHPGREQALPKGSYVRVSPAGPPAGGVPPRGLDLRHGAGRGRAGADDLGAGRRPVRQRRRRGRAARGRRPRDDRRGPASRRVVPRRRRAGRRSRIGVPDAAALGRRGTRRRRVRAGRGRRAVSHRRRLRRQDRLAPHRRRRLLGLLDRHRLDPRDRRRAEPAPRRDDQHADARRDRLELDRAQRRLQADAGRVRRDPLPPRRHGRRVLGGRLRLRRARRHAERAVRDPAARRRRRGPRPVLRAPRSAGGPPRGSPSWPPRSATSRTRASTPAPRPRRRSRRRSARG